MGLGTRRYTLSLSMCRGGAEERRRGDGKLLPCAYTPYLISCGQVRVTKRTQRQPVGDVKLVSPNVNVLHRTKRRKSQGISGRHRRLKKMFFWVSSGPKKYFLIILENYLGEVKQLNLGIFNFYYCLSATPCSCEVMFTAIGPRRVA